MKRLILIKQSDSTHLAHLYEHIFCTHIEALFYDNHLFQCLDFSLIGRTYHGGVVYIDMELYTEAATTLAKQIPTLEIKLNKTTIPTAASQLLAEEEEPFSSTGYDNVKRALKGLHAQPWQNIDGFGQLDTKTIRRRAYPFYIAEGKSLPSRKLTTSILLDVDFARSHRNLLPLFRQLAWLIAMNLQSVLAEKYAYYNQSDSYKKTGVKIGLLNSFKVAHAHDIDVDLTENLKTCFEVLRNIQRHNGFNRYATELSKISYNNHPDLAPDVGKNHEDTLIFIGSKGWQHIATPENCELLIKHMSIELKFGRKKVSSPLFKLPKVVP